MKLTNEIFAEIKDSIKGFPFIKDINVAHVDNQKRISTRLCWNICF